MPLAADYVSPASAAPFVAHPSRSGTMPLALLPRTCHIPHLAAGQRAAIKGEYDVSTAYWNLATDDLRQDWSNAGLLTADDNWNAVPSIVGYRGDDLTTATGANPQGITGTSTVVDVNVNQSNPGTYNTGGVAEFDGIPNRTVAIQGSGTADAPYLAFYLDATGRQDVRVRYNLRDLDGSADNAIQQVALQYRISPTSAWIDVPAGYVADATEQGTATKVTAVDATLPAEANNAATLEVRVITTNAVGNDEWVGVDDILVSSAPAGGGGAPGLIRIADASVGEGNDGVNVVSFEVTRVGGAAGAVEASYTVTLPGGERGADAGDFAPGTPFTGTVRFADGQATARIELAVQGDRSPEFDESFTVTLSNATGGATIDRGTATGTILNDDLLTLSIGQVQGAAHVSPVAGQQVAVQGIVTAVASNGFYLQDEGDGDSATSDAIFVFTGSAPGVFRGDGLTVQGLVSEFRSNTANLSVTQITAPVITIDTTGNPLPAAVLIGAGGLLPPSEVIDDDRLGSFDPRTDGIDFWESLEGMRVTLEAPRVVSNTTTDTFRETDVVVSGGAGATGNNARGGITISDGDYNPEKIQIQGNSTIFNGFNPDYSIGDRLGNVQGVVNYAAGVYEVLVTRAVTRTEDVTLGRETTTLAPGADQLSLATYNMENLDPTDTKFGQLARDIVTNLGRPDVLGAQEIQDANGAAAGGTLSGQATADKLIAAIRDAGGPLYAYAEIAPSAANTTGGEPNGNIRNGFFYNTERVDLVAGSVALIEGAAYNGTRRPLVASFELKSTGEEVTVVNVHLTSRGGSEPLFGANQPPLDAGDAARTAQAAGVKDYVAALLAGEPGARVAIVGDWNGFAYENAQTQLTDRSRGGVFTDLATLLPEEERYSYMFGGNAQQLDHILVTDNLLGGARYDAVHINAEFGGTRPTDHDPQLAILGLARSVPDAAAFSQAPEAAFATVDHDPAVLAYTHLATDQLLMAQVVQLV